MTAEKAGKKIRKVGERFPAEAAKYCNEKYPTIINPPNIDSISYKYWYEQLRKEIEGITATQIIIDSNYIVDTVGCEAVEKLSKENKQLKNTNKELNSALNKLLENPPPPIVVTIEKIDSSSNEILKQQLKHTEEKLNKKLRNERMYKNIFLGLAIALFLLHLVRIILKR